MRGKIYTKMYPKWKSGKKKKLTLRKNRNRSRENVELIRRKRECQLEGGVWSMGRVDIELIIRINVGNTISGLYLLTGHCVLVFRGDFHHGGLVLKRIYRRMFRKSFRGYPNVDYLLSGPVIRIINEFFHEQISLSLSLSSSKVTYN